MFNKIPKIRITRGPPPSEIRETDVSDVRPVCHTAAVQEDNYWRGLHRREVELHKLKGNLSAIRPFDYMHGVYLW